VRALLFVLLVACGGSGIEPGKLTGGIEDGSDELRVRYAGIAVPLAEIPQVAEAMGLPVGGKADIMIDVTIPKHRRQPAFSEAKGEVQLSCTACQLGDDVTKLKLKTRGDRADSFLGDGIAFGHLTFDKIELRAKITNGHIAIERWAFESQDLALTLEGTIDLDDHPQRSKINGCLSFAIKPELERRDPKTASLLALTGAMIGEDRQYHIGLRGSVGDRKMLPSCSP
jgi:type II secretion system protein N